MRRLSPPRGQFSGEHAGRDCCPREISRTWQFSNKISHAGPTTADALPLGGGLRLLLSGPNPNQEDAPRLGAFRAGPQRRLDVAAPHALDPHSLKA